MKRVMLIGLGFAVAIGCAFTLQQDDGPPTPSKFTNVDWFRIANVSYHPQHADDALKIVFEKFVPAGRSAGLPAPQLFEYSTGGEWDVTVIFPLPDGPGHLEWEMHPNDIKWMSALADQNGGIEKAQEIYKTYLSYVARFDQQIVRKRDLTARGLSSESDR